MSSLSTDRGIRRAARKLGIDEATLRDALADRDKLVVFAWGLAEKSDRSFPTVARTLGISSEKITEEISRQASIGFQRYLLENPPS